MCIAVASGVDHPEGKLPPLLRREQRLLTLELPLVLLPQGNKASLPGGCPLMDIGFFLPVPGTHAPGLACVRSLTGPPRLALMWVGEALRLERRLGSCHLQGCTVSRLLSATGPIVSFQMARDSLSPLPPVPVLGPPWAFSWVKFEVPDHLLTHRKRLTVVKRSLSSSGSSVRCEFAQDDSIYFPVCSSVHSCCPVHF